MNTVLFNRIPELRAFGNSVFPSGGIDSKISVDGTRCCYSSSDYYETGEYQSFRPTVSDSNLLSTLSIINISNKSSDLLFIYVNENRVVTQSPQGMLHGESWQNNLHKFHNSDSKSSIGFACHPTSSPEWIKPEDGNLVHAPPLS
jgi:hypothetical protein